MNTIKFKRALAFSIRYGVMILLAIVFAFPVVFMIVSSFKPSIQILRDSSTLLAFLPVGEISLNNYFKAFQII